MLRAEFFPTHYGPEALCEIQFGHIGRPTTERDSVEKAQFEICAHKWIAVQDDEAGFALLNDSKYGHRAKDGLVSLNLLRSPTFPDKTADRGTHEFTYAFTPFARRRPRHRDRRGLPPQQPAARGRRRRVRERGRDHRRRRDRRDAQAGRRRERRHRAAVREPRAPRHDGAAHHHRARAGDRDRPDGAAARRRRRRPREPRVRAVRDQDDPAGDPHDDRHRDARASRRSRRAPSGCRS